MSNTDWSIQQRQAPIGLILFSVDIFQKLIKGLWPFLLIVFFKGGDGNRDQLYFWMAIGGIVFVIVNAVLSYWFFKFQIVNEEFVVRKGYLKKVRLSVPLSRIQTINIKQNILQKILNVVSLEIDTAGAQETEIKLIAIKQDVAADLKRAFQASIDHNQQNADSDDSISEALEQKKTILSLSFIDLVKVGLTENHLRSFFIVVGVVYGLFYQVKDVFEEEANQFAKESYQVWESLSYKLYFWVAGFVLIFSIFISFVRIIFRFYDLKLTKVKEAFRIRFGLLSTKEVNVPMNKIQFIAWHQNPLRNLLNYQTLKIKQAVSGEKIKKKQSIEIPACNLIHQKEIEEAIFGELPSVFSESHSTHWFYYLRTFIFVSMAVILPTVFFWWQDLEYQISVVAFELFLALLLFLAYKKRKFRISETQLEISKGVIAQTVYRLQNYKIQAVCFQQNILIKRRGLANIIIYTAAGENLKIPYISEQLAMNLYNFLLYKVESTEKTWM